MRSKCGARVSAVPHCRNIELLMTRSVSVSSKLHIFILTYANFSAAKCVFAHLRTLFMESGGGKQSLLQQFLSVTDNDAIDVHYNNIVM